MQNLKNRPYFFAFVAALLLAGCGNQGTTGGTTIRSMAFSTPVATLYRAATLSNDVNDFKLCVRRIRLEDENDELVEAEDGSTEITFEPGLIDVSSGQQKEWGSANLPSGFTLSRIKIKVDRDENLCGVGYALSFNGVETDEEVELRWQINPPITFNTQTTIDLPLQDFVDALSSAFQGEVLDSESIKDVIEAVEEAAEIEESSNSNDDGVDS